MDNIGNFSPCNSSLDIQRPTGDQISKRVAKRLGLEWDIEPINISSRPSNVCGHEIRLCGVICLELGVMWGQHNARVESLIFEASDHLNILFRREFSVR